MLAITPTQARLHAESLARRAQFNAKATQHEANIKAQRDAAQVLLLEKAAAAKAANEDWVARQFAALHAAIDRHTTSNTVADFGPVSVRKIQNVVAANYCVTRLDLVAARRTKEVVIPRQVAAYLAKVLTTYSLPEIGRRFGGRDHTTILHAVRKIERLIEIDPVLAERVEGLRMRLAA